MVRKINSINSDLTSRGEPIPLPVLPTPPLPELEYKRSFNEPESEPDQARDRVQSLSILLIFLVVQTAHRWRHVSPAGVR